MTASEISFRERCYTCLKARSHCFCAEVPTIANRTQIVVLQHPREHGHALGTARLVALGLQKSELHVDYNRRFTREQLKLPARTGVLYPGADARPLEYLAPEERPDALIVLDGTWHHAHCLYRDIQWLHQYPTYSLSPADPSRYRIRREPAAHCVSTVESVVWSLRALEPELTGLDDLLDTFDKIIDRQIAAHQQRQGETRYKRRRGNGTSLPVVLSQRQDDLVVVYSESRTRTRTRTRAASPARSRQVLYWVGYRPATGETFAALRAPDPDEQQLSEKHLDHMGLNHEDLNSSLPAQRFRQAWQQFAKPSDVYLAWNKSTLDSLDQLGVGAAQRASAIALKACYLNLARARGCLDTIIETEDLGRAQRELQELLAARASAPGTVRLRGRALDRLANAASLLQWLQDRAAATELSTASADQTERQDQRNGTSSDLI